MIEMLKQFYWVMLGGEWPIALAALGLGYLIGSIPFGVIFTRLSGAGDIRKIGSGNIGATNVLRTGNRWAAAATLICDAGKGFLAFWIMLKAPHYWYSAPIAALGAMLGHLFPFWIRFKGGKGVATYLGIMLAMSWVVGLLFAATWAIAARVWKISSLSALIAAALAPIFVWILLGSYLAAFTVLLTIMIFITHRENIVRLRAGTEPRIGASSKTETVDEENALDAG
ncbi:MAG TPA: glycerol-3-phosphate 1-O-acyltransferase PlsY [Rhizomicrobium sp.]|jgi:glycerol-3-phosphate acyltransferase PlsY|nr:glycerol-3-phosphate 1-O-acyltransferase PlsY [Rhizomicrobium sp.]